MRKCISLLLALVLALALAPAAAEPYTLEIYWVGHGADPQVCAGVEKAVSDYVEPLIDARVRFHIVPWDDWKTEVVDRLTVKETRREMRMDLVFTADWEYYSELQEAKALLNLDAAMEDLAQQGQDLRETLSDSFWNGTRIGNGHYGVPTNKELCVPQGFIVNKTAAEAIGWDLDSTEITCTADLEPWLAKYKERYPARYPYLMDMSPAGRWVDEPWINDWSGLEQNALSMRMARGEDGTFDETVYSIFETEEEADHIRLMYDWAQKGYISPENIRMDKAGAEAIFGSGDFLVFTQPLKGNGIKAVEMYTSCHKQQYEDFEAGEIIMQPKYIVTAHTAGSMFSIPAADCDPDRAARFLYLMHTDETLVNLMLFGQEGVNYTKTDERRVALVPDAAWYNMHAGAWTVGDVRLQYVLETEDPEKNEKLIEYAADAEETCCLGFRFNTKLKELRETVRKVNETVKRFADPLLCGTVDPGDPEKGIEAFRTALKEAGIDLLREAAQQQYDDWKSSRW